MHQAALNNRSGAISIANPATPQVVVSYPTGRSAAGVATLTGERVYLANWDGGLAILDLELGNRARGGWSLYDDSLQPPW